MAYIINQKVVRSVELTINGEDLIGLINGKMLRNERTQDLIKVPTDAKVSFKVPGGADWSNTRLEVDDDCPITIRWETTKET